MTAPAPCRDLDAVEAEIRRLLDAAREPEGGDTWPAVEQALLAFGPELTGFVMLRVQDAAAAQDLMQELWLAAHAHAAGFRGEGTFRGWLFAIARNLVHRRGRAVGREQGRAVPLSQAALERLAAEVRSSVVGWRRSSVREGLQALRDELDEGDRLLLELRVDHALPWEDVARATWDGDEPPEGAALKRRVNTLTVRYKRVKQRLHRLAAVRGLLPPADG